MRLSAWPVLLFLLLIPLLHRWWKNRNRPAKVTYSLPIPKVVGSRNPVKILLMIRYVGVGLLLLSLARPQNSFKQTERTVSGVDIVMVMDVSASMNIEDLSDRPRLDIAKETMESFIKGRQNDRIGFVMFSGEAVTMAPPTLDYSLVLRGLADAQPGILKDGTAIGDGLAVAVSRLRNSTAKSRVIVLLTDGDNNIGQIDPRTAGDLAAGYGIRVYTIAIGKEGRVKLPIRRKGVLGNTVTSYQWFDNALNPQLLQEISHQTHGKFYRVTDQSTLDSVFDEINRLEKSEIKSNETVKYEEAFQKPLKWAIVTLVIEQLLSNGWWRLLI